ncbi:acyl-CoA dehydrogenase family protein [Paraglaciecola agarilytica]|uniref:acyl-CoA dehydrogenase family protein n=1 Tax=Paraglaciecola chathamensis TaxID=368405 RepID=UPI001C092ADB|nr:acyl-CoA dehydrogenase family protein [Paraglaciecola agarilytica]MBU3018770.1 acyl-CoA dehydrogenase family protein [Paraglaciecola agarilytica]
MTPAFSFTTHEVENQPQIMSPYNLWTCDSLLQTAVKLNGGQHAEQTLKNYGHVVGHQLMDAGEQANRHKPIFQPFDRYGRRTDTVEFHPAYHELMTAAMQAQVHAYSWRNPSQKGAHVVRAALMFMHYQADAGTSCPLTMTHAAVAVLNQSPNLPAFWTQKLINGEYDPRALPAEKKHAITLGMGMTEKQGGSDVRRNTTQAIKQPDGNYHVIGHKFFFSAPLCDAHLILAQTENGLSCFLLPRILPDGQLNQVRIQRLKDKLGDWSNASSEVEFQGATAYLVGEEGQGVKMIIDMVSLTRLDCMIGSTALMRQALVQALHHTQNREAFGAKLIDQPLMKNVLADLTLEVAASLALTMRVSKAVDLASSNKHEAGFSRIATAIGKYWICKRTPTFVNEAQECLGGIGYVEENVMPRLYRQAPLNSIWEGSANVQCLDVLRALRKKPEVKTALFDELSTAADKNSYYDQHLVALKQAFNEPETLEVRSRLVVEKMALGLQGALLLNGDDKDLADTFCQARLGGNQGLIFGTLPANSAFDTIINKGMLKNI